MKKIFTLLMVLVLTNCMFAATSGTEIVVDTIKLDVNLVRSIRQDSYSQMNTYYWDFYAYQYTDNSDYEYLWFNIITPQNNRLEGAYSIANKNIVGNLFTGAYNAAYVKVDSDTTKIPAGNKNIMLNVVYDKESKAYDMAGEILSQDGKTLYQFDIKNMSISAINDKNVPVVLKDSVELEVDTIDVDVDGIMFGYYASVSQPGSYNYTLTLYNVKNNYPAIALDIYTAVKDDFAGNYNLVQGNVDTYYSEYRQSPYSKSDVASPDFTISKSGDVYTIEGTFVGEDKNVYRFNVSAKAMLYDAAYPLEPMDKQGDINMDVLTMTVDSQYVSENVVYIYLKDATTTIQLMLYSSKTTLSDGIYSIEAKSKVQLGDLVAGYYNEIYNSNYGSLVGKNDLLYYLVTGTLTVATVGDTTTYTLQATSAHGTSIEAVYMYIKPASALGEVNGDGKSDSKYIQGNRLYIRKNGVMYNAFGQEVQ